MYAIIETGGKQYQVEEGQSIFVEKLNVEEGSKVSFDKVLLVSKDGDIHWLKELRLKELLKDMEEERKL